MTSRFGAEPIAAIRETVHIGIADLVPELRSAEDEEVLSSSQLDCST